MKMMTGRKRNNWREPASQRSGGRRAAAMLLAAVLVVTSVWSGAPKAQKEAYASSSWASSYLQNLVEQGVLKGDPDGRLNPDRDITRAEFAAMLNRAFGFHEMGTKQTQFSDVTPDAWYRNDIAIAANQGYLSGTSPGTANPEGKLTREEAVSMICRAIKIDEVPADPLKFSDSEKFQNWSRGYINAATQKGFINGYDDGTFRPAAPITRGEVAKMLSDAAGVMVKTPSQVNLGYVNGNVSLTQSGAGLRNTTISGDLYITEGVGLGYVHLDNVTVLGDVIISGAGQSNKGDSSVVADGCNFKNVIVNVGKDKTLSLVAQGDTVIDNTVVKSNAYLEEHNARKSAFNDVQLKGPEKTNLDLSGTFKAVRVMAPKNHLTLGKGSIEQLTVDEYGPDSTVFLEKNTSVEELYADIGTKVTGTGTISSVNISANGTDVAQMPDEVIIRPGISATVNGQHMGSVDADQSNESPKVRSGYPEVKSITSNSAEGRVMVNKPGDLYWMVKKSDADSPDKEAMKNPAADKNVVSSGKVPVADADKEITNQLSSLKPGENYALFVMLEDSKGALSRVRSQSFTTVDNTKPQFVQSYPQAEALYDAVAVGDDPTHMIKVSLVSNKDVSAYWAVLKKGDPAPGADSLVAQVPPNALLKGVNTGVKKDVLYPFLIVDEPTTTDSGIKLQENTPYDVYVCLKDASSNVSTVSKLSVTTKDVTPPDFEPDYPRMGVIQPTSVSIEYETTEGAKLYWMVSQKGAPHPGDVTGDAATDWAASDAAKQAVITGNKAYKGIKGTQTTTMNQYGTFTINGLENQKGYDLYMVLQDSTGNLSKVFWLEITTLDNTPPTAEMLFDGVGEDGQPAVGSQIRIQFSEPVYVTIPDGDTGKKKAIPISEATPAEMEHHVRLVNRSESKPTRVDIHFDKVTWMATDDGKTVMVLPSGDAAAGTPGASAIDLKSGNRYQFELRDIQDQSDNKMLTTNDYDSEWDGGKYYYPLKEFTTKAPFIELSKATVPSADYDLGWEVDPKILNAGDTLCYDSVLECNRHIFFNLSVQVGDGAITQLEAKDHKPLEMDKGKYYLIQGLLGRAGHDDYLADAKFNDLKRKKYFIKLVKVDGNEDSNSWNGEVKLTVRGVAGEPDDMPALIYKGSIAGADFKKDIAQPDTNVNLVSSPSELNISHFFTDTVAPVFASGYPQLDGSDTSILVNVMLDKPCTVYWILAPKGQVVTIPTTEELEVGGGDIPGGRSGSIKVDAKGQKRSYQIKNLPDKQNFDFFYAAKGVNAWSEVTKKDTATIEAVKPEFFGDYPKLKGPGNGSVDISVEVTKSSADVAWAVYKAGTTFNGNKEPGPLDVSGGDSKPAYGPKNYGTVLNVERDKPINFTVDKLEEGQYYDLYVTAINPLADKSVENNWIKPVAAVRLITPLDLQPPKITGVQTTLTKVTDPDSTVPSYEGTVSVTFSEPLYYRLSTADTSQPLTEAILKQFLYAPKPCRIWVDHVSTQKVTDADQITGFTLKFMGAVNGSTIQFSKPIADLNNVAEPPELISFTLKKGTKPDGMDTKWVASYSK